MENSFNSKAAMAVVMMAAMGTESAPATVPIIHGLSESKPFQLPSKGKRSKRRHAAKLRAQLAKELSCNTIKNG